MFSRSMAERLRLLAVAVLGSGSFGSALKLAPATSQTGTKVRASCGSRSRIARIRRVNSGALLVVFGDMERIVEVIWLSTDVFTASLPRPTRGTTVRKEEVELPGTQVPSTRTTTF